MRVLVTGGAGLLGSEVCRGAPVDVELHATLHRTPPPGSIRAAYHPVDLGNVSAVSTLVGELEPDVVVHTAYARTDHVTTVATTVAVVAACTRVGSWLVHLSTDAHFDGEHAPYAEADEPSPVHDYGRAKAEAERTVRLECPDAAVVRTSLIVRDDGSDPTSAWVVRALLAGERVTLFTDEVRTPIRVQDLAAQIWEIVGLGRGPGSGVWHLGGPERLSRVEIGRRVAVMLGLDASLIDAVPSPTADEPRPRDVSLSCARARATLSVRPRAIGSVRPHG